MFDNTTQIAGFVGDNHGQIDHSFATGTVGTAGTMSLAGGFAGNNEGTIDASFANGAVITGDNSTAGGFVQSNESDNNVASCPAVSSAMASTTAPRSRIRRLMATSPSAL